MILRRTAALLLVASTQVGCGDSAGPGNSAEIAVLSADRVLYADGFPAIVFTVENRGSVGVEAVNINVDAVRGGQTVATAVTQIADLAPGEQAESDPAVFATLDAHSDYECYRYRVRAYDDRARVLSDESSSEVCT